jgi:exopolyphosphatase/guanosine-5'-triphosphate,3'-diphosphate pyrophosphatase
MPRRSVIDIGTNSVKLMVADVSGHRVEPVHEAAEQTRLGRGFYETHTLQADAVSATALAVANFVAAAGKLGASVPRVFATSAARDAKNPELLRAAIESACGLSVEIISGEQEAEWAFRGVASDARLGSQPLLLLDVGGGSTEFILGQGEHKHFRQSFPLGSVRLLESLPHSDPPTVQELADCRRWLEPFLNTQVKPQLELALARERCAGKLVLVGTGGAVSLLAAMELGLGEFDRAKVDGAVLSADCVQHWVNRLWSLSLLQRRKIPGLPPERADVMLAGAAIYEAVLASFGFAELRVTARGLRYAALME